MDPALEEMIPGPPDDVLEAMIRLRAPGRMPEGFRPVTRFGDVMTGRLRRGTIARIWADPGVASLKAPRLLDFAEGPIDFSHPGPATDARRPPVPETGRGIVMGVIDWGLDVTCPAFRTASGATRLLALWDQRDLPGRPAQNPFGYGRIHDRAAIDAALATADPHRTLGYHPADADPGDGAHGTHVLDIAAGNGRHGGPVGMAPGADCVFVHLAAGALGGLANLGDSLRICEALAFIRHVAGNRPLVVNMSVGRHASPHTGTTLLERAVDAMVEAKPGRAVVMSTGNYYQADAHASGRLVPGRSDTVTWNVAAADPTINELEIWYPDSDAIHVRLEGPGVDLRAEAGLDETAEIRSGAGVVGRLYHRAFDPNTRDHHVNLFLYPGAPVGAWRLTLLPRRIRDGRWHAWVERDSACRDCQSRFDRQHADPTHTTGSICNGFLSIAVGALDITGAAPAVARFSSSGPTRDGRAKPDCVAPGTAILAARSAGFAGPTPPLTRKSGASQAAPFVAGTIALVFEAARRPLGIHDTRAILFGTAGSLPGADPLRVGAGAIDPLRAVTVARGSRLPGQAAHDLAAPVLHPVKEPAMHPFATPQTPSNVGFPVRAAASLFDSVFLDGRLPAAYAEHFELMAAPGQSLPPLLPGDLILHRPLAAPPAAELLLIADPAAAGVARGPEPDRILLRLREPMSAQENPAAAAAGAVGVIGAAKDVFDIVDRSVTVLRNNVFNGDYRLTSDVARATPFSRNIAPVQANTMRVRYTLEAHDPVLSNPSLAFYVVMEADCLNIYSVEIGKDDGASTTLYSSSFEINFRAHPEQPPGQRMAVIDFAISGRWDPRGPGDRAFTGQLRVRADGVMTIRIEPKGGWVRLKDRRVLQMLRACPAPDAVPAGMPPPAPITPPDGPRPRPSGRSGGGSRPSSSTAALLSRLPSGPHITHLFFTTSNTQLPVNEVNRLHGWFIRLSPVLQAQIRSGTLPVLVSGHASPSGPADANMALSFQRAQAAGRALRDIVGPQAELRIEGLGSTGAVGTAGSNDQADRRATIRISPAAP